MTAPDPRASGVPRVSVVLCVIDPHPVYFPLAVASILEQTERDLELIVVEEPSSAGAGELLARFDDARIRHLLHDEKFTIAGAKKVLSGQADEAVPLDTGGVREAAERLTALRTRIKEARDRLGKPLSAPEPPGEEA